MAQNHYKRPHGLFPHYFFPCLVKGDNVDNEEILKNMVRGGFNDLYLEVVDAPSIKRALTDVYNMSEEDIRDSKFEVADKILQLALLTSGNKKEEKVDTLVKSMSTTEKYQMWMGIVIIVLFGVSIMLLIYNPIPDGNDDLLVVLATWLGKDVTMIISYYHGSSYGSFVKTQSMIQHERDIHEFDQTTRPTNRKVPDKRYMAKHL